MNVLSGRLQCEDSSKDPLLDDSICNSVRKGKLSMDNKDPYTTEKKKDLTQIEGKWVIFNVQ